jgi:pimeloyl-ACP methyl ester carboxylesterase
MDVFALPAHADYYLEPGEIERLLHEALDAVQALGYRRLWLLGISLGGMGALLCATQRPKQIAGVLLLAPFLGTRGVISEVTAAGGLRCCRQQNHADPEHAFLATLAHSLLNTPDFPPIHLGYGLQDDYIAASKLLAECLPPQRVIALPGGHDWETWQRLWQALLDSGCGT